MTVTCFLYIYIRQEGKAQVAAIHRAEFLMTIVVVSYSSTAKIFTQFQRWRQVAHGIKVINHIVAFLIGYLMTSFLPRLV